MHKASVLLCVGGKCVLCDLSFSGIANVDANSVLDVLNRSVLACLVPRQLAEYGLVSVLKEMHVVKRVFVIISPIKLERVYN